MLPDPHLRDVKFESITEMGPIPPVLSDFSSILKTGDLRTYLDQYLLGRGSPSFLPSLKDRLRLPAANEASETYNLSLLNSLVMYIGVSSVAQAKARSGSSLFNPSDPGVIALQYLATNLDAEGEIYRGNIRPINCIINYLCRSASPSQCHGIAPALSQRTHPLVQLSHASPFPGS